MIGSTGPQKERERERGTESEALSRKNEQSTFIIILHESGSIIFLQYFVAARQLKRSMLSAFSMFRFISPIYEWIFPSFAQIHKQSYKYIDTLNGLVDSELVIMRIYGFFCV